VGKEVRVKEGESLLLALRRSGVAVPSLCGGLGVCGKCLVKVKAVFGRLNEPGPAELSKIGPLVNRGWRLACFTHALEDSTVVFELAEAGSGAYIATGLEPEVPLSPIGECRSFSMSLKSVEPLDVALLREVGARGLSVKTLRKLSEVNATEVEGIACVYKGEVIDVELDDGHYGVAVDVGTTKIAGQLIDLNTGSTLSFDFVENPQRIYGGDPVARIKALVEGEVTIESLREITLRAINEVVERLTRAVGVDKQRVLAASIVGNPIMEHIVLGVNPTRISSAPYSPIQSLPLEVRAREVGLSINENAVVLVFPNVSGFVGGDAVADALTLTYLNPEEPSILIDIGTNSEVILLADGRIYVASAPAGSAIEGVGLSSGTHAIQGAIDGVYVDEGLKVRYTTIGGGKPVGITGSGYIDLVAWLIRRGILDRSGRLKVEVFEVARGEETAHGNPLILTRKDVRLIQQAKAAISSAWRTLLKEAKVREDELKGVFVAGSFGFRLNKENVLEIGLLPKVPPDRVVYLGNSAIVGAKIALKYKPAWVDRIPSILEKVTYVEFALHPDYQRIFADSLRFE